MNTVDPKVYQGNAMQRCYKGAMEANRNMRENHIFQSRPDPLSHEPSTGADQQIGSMVGGCIGAVLRGNNPPTQPASKK